MSLPVAFGVYFICWWLVLFALLPLGAHAPGEGEEITPGNADSAPVTPHILRKFVAATLISAVLFAIVYAVIAYRLIPLDLFPSAL